MENYGLDLYGLPQGQAAGSCKHGYEIYNVYKQPTNALYFYYVFLIILFHQHVSTCNPVIFRMMFLIQEYNCS